MNADLLLGALREIAALASSAADTRTVANAAVARACALLDADGAVLRRWDETAQRLYPVQSSGAAPGAERLLKLGEDLEGQALLARGTQVVADYPSWSMADPAVVAGGLRSAVALPLLAAARPVGTLLVGFTRTRVARAQEIEALTVLASHVAQALDAAWLRAQAERQRARHAAIQRLVQRYGRTADHERLLTDVLAEAVALLGGAAGVMNQWDDSLQMLRPLRRQMPSDCPPMNLASGQGVSGRAIRDRAPVIVNDYPAVCGRETDTAHLGFQAAVAVPLLSAGRVLGSLAVFCSDPTMCYSSEDAALLEILAGISVALLEAVEHERLQRTVQMSRATQHDVLSQLMLALSSAELMRAAPNLPENVRQIANQLFWDAATAANLLNRLQRISHPDR